jgi:uncharacterized protein (DUF2267 family)
MSELASLDRAFQATRLWMKEISKELQWTDERRLYLALRTVLHGIRDRVTLPEAVQFGAQLPTFIRGMYYEGWRPGPRPVRNRTQDAFLEEIRAAFAKTRMAHVDAEAIAKSVFSFLNRKIAGGELTDVRDQLPKAVRLLWPDTAAKDRARTERRNLNESYT